MIKRLLITACIPIVLTSCTPTKQEVIDKCISQANETFAKEDIASKGYFVHSCVIGEGYSWIRTCNADNKIDYFVSTCYALR